MREWLILARVTGRDEPPPPTVWKKPQRKARLRSPYPPGYDSSGETIFGVCAIAFMVCFTFIFIKGCVL